MKYKSTIILLFLIFTLEIKAQTISELLGRPTPSSVTISFLADTDLELFYEYGTKSGTLNQTIPTLNSKKDVPVNLDLTGLTANTQYFYRARYRTTGSNAPFLLGAEHAFRTPRPAGNTFSFAIEADPHLDANSIPESYTLTLQNIQSKKPDFMIDLGDNFMSEKQPSKNQQVFTDRHLLFRSFYDKVCHSIPLYLVLGNHEGEVGWSLDGTDKSNPVLIANTRKLYYPNPLPNNFYSGNTKEEPFVGLRGNYYAFEWGDALFVVLDPYWYTPQKSEWNWTLGTEQYNWFKKTLSESKAKFKFVFCHHLVGGYTSDARGGAEYADFFEMGGKNLDGTYGFDSFRPGWQKSIHTLMKENKVTVFFHGHDHFFGKQEKDGIIYQEVPQPSNRSLTNISATQYGYVNGVFMPGRGYLNVTVSPENVKVDYIKTYLPNEETASQKNGEVAYSYTVNTVSTGIGESITEPGTPVINQNFPNPFSGSTQITYAIDCTTHVELKVVDIFGREVVSLVNQTEDAGFYTRSFDAGNLKLQPGVYFGQLIAGNFRRNIRMVYSK